MRYVGGLTLLLMLVLLALIGAMLLLARNGQAHTIRCGPFDALDCGQHVHKRTYRKPKPKRARRKPQVRAYVKKDDDGVQCKDLLTVIGDARPSEKAAREDADAVFMRAVRFRYGESWMEIENARDYAVRCARASITEIIGQTMVRCELKARPCRGPFQSK